MQFFCDSHARYCEEKHCDGGACPDEIKESGKSKFDAFKDRLCKGKYCDEFEDREDSEMQYLHTCYYCKHRIRYLIKRDSNDIYACTGCKKSIDNRKVKYARSILLFKNEKYRILEVEE